jgi:hypothetical protein
VDTKALPRFAQLRTRVLRLIAGSGQRSSESAPAKQLS